MGTHTLAFSQCQRHLRAYTNDTCTSTGAQRDVVIAVTISQMAAEVSLAKIHLHTDTKFISIRCHIKPQGAIKISPKDVVITKFGSANLEVSSAREVVTVK